MKNQLFAQINLINLQFLLILNILLIHFSIILQNKCKLGDQYFNLRQKSQLSVNLTSLRHQLYKFSLLNCQNLMAQIDEFYNQLPYTLQEGQTTPEYVIFGTGMQQTLIAAYKSKMEGKQGIIIDTSKTYGSSLKTVTFKEFNELNTGLVKENMYHFVTPQNYSQSNTKFYQWSVEAKKHRGYSIDIEPNFFLASSNTCECLKQADMDKYMDFHLVNSILHLEGKQIKPVPLSKGKIFESKDLSLLEKKNLLSTIHKLIKIYQRYFKLEQDLNSTKQFDKDSVSIDESLYAQFEANLSQFYLPFIQKLVKKSKKLLNFLSYIICNYQYNYSRPIPEYAKEYYSLKSFIQKFGKFIKSCGIYGQIPYLYVDNGIGDVPQAFSRIASIYGSVYILHPKVSITSITKASESGSYIIASNLSPEKPITTKEVYFGPTQLQLRNLEEQFYQQKLLRVLVLSEKNGKQEKCPAICFINELADFANPIYLFMFDGNTHSCPNQLMIHQFQSIIGEQSEEQVQQKAEKLLQTLESVYGEGFKSSVKYYSVYIRTRRYPKKSTKQQHTTLGIGLNDTMGIDLDQHFANFMNIIGHQQNYFKKDNPNQLEQQKNYGDYEAQSILQKMNELNLKHQSIKNQGKNGNEIQEQLSKPVNNNFQAVDSSTTQALNKDLPPSQQKPQAKDVKSEQVEKKTQKQDSK